MQQAALLQARPSPNSAVGEKPTLFGRCTDLVLWLVYVLLSYALPPHTLLLEPMPPVFHTVGCAILHCAFPLCTTVRADVAVFLQLAVRSCTVLGQMLSDFYTVGGAILYCATVRYTTVGAVAARFFYRWLRYPLLGYPPRTLLLGLILPVFILLAV